MTTSAPAIRKPPVVPVKPTPPGPDFLYGHAHYIRDFYVDDVEEVFTAMAGVCKSVSMESHEYSGITLDNITGIQLEKLGGFRFEGTEPEAHVNLLSDTSVTISVKADDDLHRRLFDHLKNLFEARQRRVLGMSQSTFWIYALVVPTLALLILMSGLMAYDAPSWALVMVAIAALAFVFVSTKKLNTARPLVVYPMWKRDAPATQGINWREQIVTFVQGLLLLVIGFLLGKYS